MAAPRLHRSFFVAAFIPASISMFGCHDQPDTVPPELDPNEHMLFTPRGNPEELLGRAVTQDEAGGLLIADARAPGCKVKIRQVPQAWTRTYTQDLGRVADFNAGRAQLAQLVVQFGQTLRVDARIINSMVLEADLENCPGTVIQSVKVGTGYRDVFFDSRRGGEAKVRIKGVDVGGGGGSWKSVSRGLQWEEPQAWAFTLSESDDSLADSLELAMPERLTEGDVFELQILSRKQVWLIMLVERADGSWDLRLPNSSLPAPSVAANGVLTLPPLRASLDVPGAASHERLVVCGFTERADFDTFRPPPGALSPARMNEYVAELQANLEQIPQRRWIRATFDYVISPATAPAAESMESNDGQ